MGFGAAIGAALLFMAMARLFTGQVVQHQGLFKSFGLTYFHQCYMELGILRDYGDLGSNGDVKSMLARYEERLKEVNGEHPNVKVFVRKMTDLLTVNVNEAP
jgi:hypothetical protein